jgi:hypothetical protein
MRIGIVIDFFIRGLAEPVGCQDHRIAGNFLALSSHSAQSRIVPFVAADNVKIFPLMQARLCIVYIVSSNLKKLW